MRTKPPWPAVQWNHCTEKCENYPSLDPTPSGSDSVDLGCSLVTGTFKSSMGYTNVPTRLRISSVKGVFSLPFPSTKGKVLIARRGQGCTINY